MLYTLRFLILPSVLLLSPEHIVYDSESFQKENSSTSNETLEEDSGYKMFENYYPLFILLYSLSENETESLEKYLNQRTYAELKRMIDDKKKENNISPMVEKFENNNTDLSVLVAAEENRKYVDLVQAYHNASIYSAIRGVWNSNLDPYLPTIDQLAILEYFSEKKSSEVLNMSFWTRLWQAIRQWLAGTRDTDNCNADRPRCMRAVLEKMPMESRIALDDAARNENCQKVEKIVMEELQTFPASAKSEFEGWQDANTPPSALLHIVNTTTDIEMRALQRLRTHDLIHSIKDYYRAVIEARSPREQEEIRQFFERMNDTFARCFNPTRSKYEFYS